MVGMVGTVGMVLRPLRGLVPSTKFLGMVLREDVPIFTLGLTAADPLTSYIFDIHIFYLYIVIYSNHSVSLN